MTYVQKRGTENIQDYQSVGGDFLRLAKTKLWCGWASLLLSLLQIFFFDVENLKKSQICKCKTGRPFYQNIFFEMQNGKCFPIIQTYIFRVN